MPGGVNVRVDRNNIIVMGVFDARTLNNLWFYIESQETLRTIKRLKFHLQLSKRR